MLSFNSRGPARLFEALAPERPLSPRGMPAAFVDGWGDNAASPSPQKAASSRAPPALELPPGIFWELAGSVPEDEHSPSMHSDKFLDASEGLGGDGSTTGSVTSSRPLQPTGTGLSTRGSSGVVPDVTRGPFAAAGVQAQTGDAGDSWLPSEQGSPRQSQEASQAQTGEVGDSWLPSEQGPPRQSQEGSQARTGEVGDSWLPSEQGSPRQSQEGSQDADVAALVNDFQEVLAQQLTDAPDGPNLKEGFQGISQQVLSASEGSWDESTPSMDGHQSAPMEPPAPAPAHVSLVDAGGPWEETASSRASSATDSETL